MPKRRRRPRTALRDGPDPVDVHVGKRIRERRVSLGLSQTDLGDNLGLTFQQIQKYERGFNRISASKLWALSHLFEVPIGWFFDGLGKAGKGQKDVMTRPGALELEVLLGLPGIHQETSLGLNQGDGGHERQSSLKRPHKKPLLMTADTDILRAANELIEQHGLKSASDYAADRIKTLGDFQDHDGVAVWRQIRAAFLDLSDIRFKDDPVNVRFGS